MHQSQLTTRRYGGPNDLLEGGQIGLVPFVIRVGNGRDDIWASRVRAVVKHHLETGWLVLQATHDEEHRATVVAESDAAGGVYGGGIDGGIELHGDGHTGGWAQDAAGGLCDDVADGTWGVVGVVNVVMKQKDS